MQHGHPSIPSGTRRLASRRPVSSTISTSWWASAQSSPMNNTALLPPPVGHHQARTLEEKTVAT
jgi:hypothetical protein